VLVRDGRLVVALELPEDQAEDQPEPAGPAVLSSDRAV
jgi:hypothetical protein